MEESVVKDNKVALLWVCIILNSFGAHCTSQECCRRHSWWHRWADRKRSVHNIESLIMNMLVLIMYMFTTCKCKLFHSQLRSCGCTKWKCFAVILIAFFLRYWYFLALFSRVLWKVKFRIWGLGYCLQLQCVCVSLYGSFGFSQGMMICSHKKFGVTYKLSLGLSSHLCFVGKAEF